MKSLALCLFTMTFFTAAMAGAEVDFFDFDAEPVQVFQGTTDSGESCSIEVADQGSFITVYVIVGDVNYTFFNEMYEENGKLPNQIRSFFEEKDGQFSPIIGAPMFWIGSLYDVSSTFVFGNDGVIGFDLVSRHSVAFDKITLGEDFIMCR